MRRKTSNTHGQNLIEYAIVVALISAAVTALSTYVFRSIQATQKAVTEEFAKE
jgi:Flp pilus assembly pilin Flp